MRERYERIFTLPGLLYTQGSPIIVEAGALLKDNQYNTVVAQLKFRNISEKIIKAVSVNIFALDIAQRSLGEPVIFQYLDLSASRDDNFGQNIPVNLPNPETRAFYISIREIIFDNNEVWNTGEKAWQSLPMAFPLDDFFKDPEMTKQFKIRFGSDCSVCPTQIGDLWYCACGNINHTYESICHHCGKRATDLFHVNLGALAKEKDERLQKEAWEKHLAEQKAAAEQVQKEAQERARKKQLEQERIEAEKISRAKKKKTIMIVVSIIIVILLYLFVGRPIIKYNNAEKKLAVGEFDAAIKDYAAAGFFRDSAEKIKMSYYEKGKELIAKQKYQDAYAAFLNATGYADTNNYLQKLQNTFVSVSAGLSHTVGLKADGTVVAVGNNEKGQCDVSGWENIVAISAGDSHTVGLKADGTVVAVGSNLFKQCNVSDWNDIKAISAGWAHTVGLKSDGTVVAVGNNDDKQCRVSNWNNIVSIAAGSEHSIGLKSDGTVVATGSNQFEQCNVSDWGEILMIAASGSLSAGVKSDGSVVEAGFDLIYSFDDPDLSSWKNISYITIGDWTILGLKSDGTVYADEFLLEEQYPAISEWNDIIAISASEQHVVGLKSNGTVVATGKNDHGQCDVVEWNKYIE